VDDDDFLEFVAPATGVPSPCNNICRLESGACVGCGRTGREIAEWSTANDDRKRAILAAVAARRR
jgi:uncharacterized protein